jgi:hypothetical protein
MKMLQEVDRDQLRHQTQRDLKAADDNYHWEQVGKQFTEAFHIQNHSSGLFAANEDAPDISRVRRRSCNRA